MIAGSFGAYAAISARDHEAGPGLALRAARWAATMSPGKRLSCAPAVFPRTEPGARNETHSAVTVRSRHYVRPD